MKENVSKNYVHPLIELYLSSEQDIVTASFDITTKEWIHEDQSWGE